MVAAALRRCRGCGRELPLAPIPRFEVCEDCGWEPAPGPQTQFLAENAFEVLYGGAAGGGKSDALLMGATRHVGNGAYRALLLRRTYPELERSLIPRAQERFDTIAPGGYVGSPTPRWRFPSGAVIEFGHLQHETDLAKYQSAEYQYIGFDELAHFTEKMFTYMLSRLRSSKGIPSRVRAGSNPPHDLTGAWMVKRWAPWLDRSPDYHGVRAESGQRLFYVNSRAKGERYVERGTLDEEGNAARARVFIRALIAANPYLDRNDPGYRSSLLALDPVSRAQLLDGDFSRIDKPGAVWNRTLIDAGRRTSHPVLTRVGIGLDPSGSHRKGSDEAGIIPAGVGPCWCSGERENHAFVFDDLSGVLPATMQARRSIAAYHDLNADFVVAEINYGGEWIKATINEIDPSVNVDVVHVTKGKAVRAEPVAALYGKLEDDGTVTGCKVHHVGTLAGLENEMCTLDPREPPKISPGRLDALVFVLSKLLLGAPDGVEGIHSDGQRRWDPRRDRGRMMT